MGMTPAACRFRIFSTASSPPVGWLLAYKSRSSTRELLQEIESLLSSAGDLTPEAELAVEKLLNVVERRRSPLLTSYMAKVYGKRTWQFACPKQGRESCKVEVRVAAAGGSRGPFTGNSGWSPISAASACG